MTGPSGWPAGLDAIKQGPRLRWPNFDLMRRRELLGLCVIVAAGGWLRPAPVICELEASDITNSTEVAGIARARLRCLGSSAWVEGIPQGIRVGFHSEEERLKLLPTIEGRSPFQLMLGHYDPRAQRQMFNEVDPLGQELRAFPDPDPEYRIPRPQPSGPAYIFQGARAVRDTLEVDLAIRNTKSHFPYSNLQFQLAGEIRPVSLATRAGGVAPSGYWPGRLTVDKVQAELGQRWASVVRCGTYPCSLEDKRKSDAQWVTTEDGYSLMRKSP